MSRLARLLAFCLLPLAGCGLITERKAVDPYGPMVGIGVTDLLACAGIPDSKQRISDELAVLEWSLKSDAPALKLTVAILGSVEVGNSGSGKMVALVSRTGTVVNVAFPQATVSLTGGPYDVADLLAGECVRHPNTISVKAGQDWFQYLFAANAPASIRSGNQSRVSRAE